MDNNLSTKKYVLEVPLSQETADQLAAGATFTIYDKENTEIQGSIIKQEKVSTLGQLRKVLPYFKKQIKAAGLPMKDQAGRNKFLVLAIIDTILSATVNLSAFFVRGWRLEIIRKMARFEADIAPGIHTITDVGRFMREGITIVLVKALYDIPKILFIITFGYEFIELGLDFVQWLFNFFLGQESAGYIDYARENEMFSKFGFTVTIKIIFWILYSLAVTPAFKIMTFRYALGEIDFKGFFNLKLIYESFRIYRKYPRSTVAAYIWSQSVGVVTTIAALILLPIVSFLAIFFYPSYFLMLKHWPKAYGYGRLARMLVVNGEIGKGRNTDTL